MPPLDWSDIVAIFSVAVAVATWLTSASKSRVEQLRMIVDAQAEHIEQLKGRIADLEAENRCYLKILSYEGIDPETYCTPEEQGNGQH